MKVVIFSTIIVGLIGVSFIYMKRSKHNVCKTFADYYSNRDNNNNCYYNPDYNLTVPDIIRRHGYPVEIYKVTTEDGYILTIFWIPYGKNSVAKKPGSPVFLQHGFASSCACFINRKEKSLGFSMGTMAMYLYGITYPEAASQKIKIFINLAPSAFLGEHKSLLRYVLPYWYIVEPVVQAITNGKIFARLSISPKFLKQICYPFPIQLKLCQLPEMIAFGSSYEHNDPETLPVSLIQNADWASVKSFTHVTQLTLSGNFQQYDYGIATNSIIYGSPEPPHYNLTKLKIPTYFIRAENDLLATKENVEKLYRSLPKDVTPYDIYVIKDENFSHLDFITAKDVVPLLYDHIVDFIRSQ